MKKLLLILLPLSIFAQSESELKQIINDQTVVHETDLIEDRNCDCSEEFGATLFNSDAVNLMGIASCASSCHVPENNFAPTNNTGSGSIFTRGRWSRAIYFPSWAVRDSTKNSPQLEVTRYKKKVLQNLQTTKEGQASEAFGGFAHNIDWTVINENELFKSYLKKCYGVKKGTEQHFIQAILDYENAQDVNNSFTKWLESDISKRYIYEGALALYNNGCLDCHSGKGLVSDTLHNGDAVRSMHNSESYSAYGWDGKYKTTYGFLEYHHLPSLGIELNKADQKAILKFIKKGCND